jgi:MFS transporter, putative metabolite:H+ symporter
MTLLDTTTFQEPVPAKQASVSARLDRLPASPYLQRLIARIAIGGWFEFFDLFMASNVALGLLKAGIFTATTTGFFDWKGFASFVAAGFSGMFLGTIFVGGISDRFGRKIIFTYSLFAYSLATIIMAWQSSPIAIDVWRFFAGIGIGVQLVTIDTYIAEISPNATRGHNLAFSHFISYTSVPFAAMAALFLIPRTILGVDGWRWLSMIGGLGAPLFLLVRSGLPESPRWYESRGMKLEAEATILKMEAGVRESLGKDLPSPLSSPNTQRASQSSNLSTIFSPPYRSRTAMLVTFNVFQTVGFYGFASWVPILLMKQGVSFVSSLAYTFAIASMNPVGALVAMKYADIFERKWQLFTLALASAALGLMFSQARKPAMLIIFGGLVTIANTWFSCILHTYQAELYPTSIRAKAVGFVFSWSRISAIFVGFVIAALLKTAGVAGVFVFVACSMCIVATVVAIKGPRSSRLLLETVSGETGDIK